MQGLIDALSDFCASAGLEISATKTQAMQFLPLVRNRPLPEQHSFSFGSDTASICPVNTSRYKYPGVTFCSSGNTSDYMPAARHNMVGAYICWIAAALLWVGVRQACSPAVAALHRIVTTSAMYAGELWRVHPRSAAQRRMTARIPAPAHSCVSQHRNNNPPRRAWPPVPATKVVAGFHSLLECAGCLAGGRLFP